MASDNYIDYPSMVREREEEIQQGNLAKSDDINAELNAIVDTYNRLVALLQGEFGGTGRIYELVENAVTTATQALNKANNAVDKYGDTMIGHLLIELTPASDYDVVNKLYVDDLVNNTTGPIANNVTTLIDRLNNLTANNVKLDNANFVSNNVNDGMNELFQSVSNGKKAIADALTDKGYETSATATFQTMASRIYDILTFTEGTTGGNITPETVLKGYIGYSKGAVIVGTHECDAEELLKQADPLIPDNIAYGKKAFGSNGLVVGTHQDGGQYPTIGTDTSDGTATAMDVLDGKIAYSRGVRLVGKLKQVEEVVSIETDDVALNFITGFGETPTYRAIAFSPNHYGHFVALSSDGKKLYSYLLVNDQVATMETVDPSGVVVSKKYEYSLTDLGLPEDATMTGIKVGASGYNNKPIALLYIVYSNGIVAVPYHLYDSGYIGNLPGETYHTVEIPRPGGSFPGIGTPNNIANKVILVNSNTISTVVIDLIANSATIESSNTYPYTSADAFEVTLSSDDKVVHARSTYTASWSTYVSVVTSALDENYASVGTINVGTASGRVWEVATYDDSLGVAMIGSQIGGLYKYTVEAGSVVLGDQIATMEDLGIESSYRPSSYTKASITRIGPGNYLYVAIYSDSYMRTGTVIARLITVNDRFEYTVKELTAQAKITSNENGLMTAPVISGESAVSIVWRNGGAPVAYRYTISGEENVIAVKYRGNVYYKASTALTATPADVTAGETFIGSTGYPEIGTRG